MCLCVQSVLTTGTYRVDTETCSITIKNEVYSTPHASWPQDTICLQTERAKTRTNNRDRFYCTFYKACIVIYIYIYIYIYILRTNIYSIYIIYILYINTYLSHIYLIFDIFINCNWAVTRWQYTFSYKQYMEQHK